MTSRLPALTQFSDSRRRVLAATAGLALAFGGVRLASSQTPDETSTGDWSFTDDRGVTATFAEPPTVVIAQTSSAAALWDYGYRVAGIFGPSRTPTGEVDAQTGNIDLDAVTVLGDYGEIDAEAVVALGAQLYVDLDRGTGALWYDPGVTFEQFDELVQSVGFIAYAVPVTDIIDRYGELAGALGADLQAPDVVAAREELASALADLETAIAGNAGLRVMAIAGSPATGTFVVNPGVAPDLFLYDSLGLGLVVPDQPDPAQGGNFEVRSWEEIGRYPADVILVDSRADLATLEGDDLWEGLPAVQAGQVGRWEGTYPLSPTGFAPVVRNLTAVIQQSVVIEQ